ncbi:MFS transporter [Chelativorans sp. Marseille-P2723]|uniref:MFS transporter n=1 Tax=Chelativorans sp. Marseille-P2723 TaxID=2709133 RepID=UPI00156F226D|nr:MFS transporter [Chelativorans sp. Marseille-P2723]
MTTEDAQQISLLRNAVQGRGRAVPILGLVQIAGWGATYYAPALLAPLIAAEREWSLTFTISGITIGLIVAGLCSPLSTRWVDRAGGQVAIAIGALLTAGALVALTLAASKVAYIGAWIWLGAGMSLVLSDSSYVALARIFRDNVRRPMVLISMMAGLAGSVSWASTYLLLQVGSWRTPLLLYAGVFAFLIAPLLAYVLPREAGTPAASAQKISQVVASRWPPRGLPLWLLFMGFASYAFAISATLAHIIPMMARSGVGEGTAVAISMLLGPMQLAVRLFEFMFGQRSHPLLITRAAVVTFFCAFATVVAVGFSTPTAVLFVLMMGFANGVMTIARGVLPLALFGHDGYPKAAGILGFGSLGSQAIGPLALAIVIERGSDFAALVTLAGIMAASILCFGLVRRPQ